MKYILLILVWCLCLDVYGQEKIIYKGENHLLVIEGNCMIVYNLVLDVFDEETQLRMRDYKKRYRKTLRKNKFLTRLSPIEIAKKLNYKVQTEQLFSYEQVDSIYKKSIKESHDLQGFQTSNITIFDTVHIEKNKKQYSIQFHSGLDWLSSFFTVNFKFQYRKIKDLDVD